MNERDINPPITYFFDHFGATKQVMETTLKYIITFEVEMTNLLANSCLFTHQADTEQHLHLFGIMFVSS